MKNLILALNKLDFLNIFTDFEIKEIIEESSRTYNILGTDNQGRDVFARLVYAFKISLLFAIIVWSLSYTIGIIVGSTIGYIGGKLDLFGYRIIEIYSSMPFLFLLMILASFIKPSIFILAMAYYIELIGKHTPCNLCTLERIPYFIVAVSYTHLRAHET